jgi:hypothetical protein
MSKYSYFNLIKRRAQALAKSDGLSLSAAQEHISRLCGFDHFHELTQVAKTSPNDLRLMMGAVGVTNYNEILNEGEIWDELYFAVEDAMNGDVADTNASNYSVEDAEVLDSAYDAATGVVNLSVSLQYNGDQDDDRPWAGNKFFIEAEVRLVYRGDWGPAGDDFLVITHVETDRDRDRGAEIEDFYGDHLAQKAEGSQGSSEGSSS